MEVLLRGTSSSSVVWLRAIMQHFGKIFMCSPCITPFPPTNSRDNGCYENIV